MGRPAGGGADQAAQEGGQHARLGHAPQPLGVELDRDREGRLGAERRVKELQAPLLREHPDAAPLHPLAICGVQIGGHLALGLPKAPGDRGRGQPLRVAGLGEGVEEDVGGGVVALAGSAEGAGGRGEHRKGRELFVFGQLVQVPGGVCLGCEDAFEALGIERGDRCVIERSGAVDHRSQGMALGDPVEQGCELLCLGDVTGAERDLGSQLLEAGAELFGSLCLGARAACQEQVAGAVLFDQVGGEQGAEAPGGAGDQDGFVWVDRVGALCGGLGGGAAGEPCHKRLSLAQGDLGLGGIGGCQRRQLRRCHRAVCVEEAEALWVLCLG